VLTYRIALQIVLDRVGDHDLPAKVTVGETLVEDDIGGVIVWGPSEGIVAPVGERVLAAWARRSEGLLVVAE
jgi:hypothetical protein